MYKSDWPQHMQSVAKLWCLWKSGTSSYQFDSLIVKKIISKESGMLVSSARLNVNMIIAEMERIESVKYFIIKTYELIIG